MMMSPVKKTLVALLTFIFFVGPFSLGYGIDKKYQYTSAIRLLFLFSCPV
jgi:hypothetical protein